MSSHKCIFLGVIISSNSSKNLNILNGFVAVENGKITNMGTKADYATSFTQAALKEYKIIELNENQFLVPGFIDCHVHAPQFPNIGLGLDRPLLEWLDKYTFPLEKQYSDKEFAAKVYSQVVQRLLKNGTTTACYFGSLSLEGTMQLVDSIHNYGQRALVGKVSMNILNDIGYFNDTKTEIEETETFVTKVLDMKNDLIKPVISPRFALSCDNELMTKLSAIAKKYDCNIQSHISENPGEIELVLQNFPDAKSYTEVYDKTKILNTKCIMAHAIHLSEEEMSTFAARGVSVAHCPASNTRLMSGLCPLRRIMDHGIETGLGTDVSGGDSASILDAMRRAMDVSAHLHLTSKSDSSAAISWKEALYLATLGGAKALNLDNKIGSLEVGKEFDALLINVYVQGGAIDHYDCSVAATDTEKAEGLLQRFVYLGDDRNIERVYVKGVETKTGLIPFCNGKAI